MGRVSVVIPTASRPETLEITLRAVSRQVSSDLIGEVIVSENLSDRRSEAVCAKFPELSITYKFRAPVFSGAMCGFEHVGALFAEARSEIVALVCDDDVWSPGHIATAVESLDRHPNAVAHFSAFYGAESELSLEAYQWGAPLLWLAAGRPDRFSEYEFDDAQMLALGWVFTPFHWSTMVARREHAVAATPAMMQSPHPFYADRMLVLGLAEQGPLLFDPAVDTLYRTYHGNWVASQDPGLLLELRGQGEDVVRARAEKTGIDLASLWRSYLADLPEEIVGEVNRWMVDRFTRAELNEHGFAQFLPAPLKVNEKVLGRLGRAYGALAGKGLSRF